MSKRLPKVGEIHWGRRPKSSPEGTMWMQQGSLNEKGNGKWKLVAAINYETDTDVPFLLPPEFDTPKKGTEGTQSTFLGKIEGTEQKGTEQKG